MADALKKLEHVTQRDPEFSPEDRLLIQEMVAAYRGWLALGKAAKFLIVGLAAVAGAVTAYNIILNGVRSWLLP